MGLPRRKRPRPSAADAGDTRAQDAQKRRRLIGKQPTALEAQPQRSKRWRMGVIRLQPTLAGPIGLPRPTESPHRRDDSSIVISKNGKLYLVGKSLAELEHNLQLFRDGKGWNFPDEVGTDALEKEIEAAEALEKEIETDDETGSTDVKLGDDLLHVKLGETCHIS